MRFATRRQILRQSRDRRTKDEMVVALARRLLIGLWRMITTGEIPQGVVLRLAA
jgi:hypothetical protein